MEVRTGGAPSRCAFSKLGFGFPDSGIPDSIVEVVFLGRRADLFKDRHFGPVKGDLVADPGLRVRLWIGERHRKLQVVRVNSTIALLEAHLVAVRTAEMIEPGSVVITNGLDDERISFPFADRVSPPCRIRILGEFAAIRPDGAPYVMELHVLQHPVWSLNELKGPQVRFPKVAWITHRFTVRNFVVPGAGRYRTRSIAGLGGFELCLSPCSHRRGIGVGSHLRRRTRIYFDGLVIERMPLEITPFRGHGPNG